MNSPEPVLFVDRDGVINRDYVGDYVKTWELFEFLPGTLEALATLKRSGFQTVIVSNQAGIGDGAYDRKTLDEITRRMLEEIRARGGEMAAVFYCLHGKQADCDCRKPKTGLFRQAARRFSFDPARTFYIGDKISDIQAGKNYGLRTIMVLTGYGREHQQEITAATAPDFVCADLKEAVEIVLQEELKTKGRS